MKRSLFPLKQKLSIFDIFKKGFLNFLPFMEEDKNKNDNSENIKIKDINEKPTKTVSINNYVNKNEEKIINGGIISEDIKNEETNVNSKRHKKYSSTIPTNYNHELIEKKILNEKKDLNEDKNNLKKEEGKSNNKNSGRESDCSENISNISFERKIPCFKTNFEEEISDNGIRKNTNYDNNV